MKKLFFSILMLLYLLFFSSCNQNILGIGAALKNAATLPLDGLRQAHQYLTSTNHSSLSERTRRAHEIRIPDQVACVPIENNSLTTMFEDIRSEICTCREWGTCPAPTCPCDTLCPNHYGIFKRPGRETTEFLNAENSLAFINASYNYDESKYPLSGGYCWGHTLLNQQLFRLGFFDSNKSPPFNEGSVEWLDFYKNIIRDIRRNKPREIPGFSSIEELTDHPSIQEFLVNDIIPQAWASSAVSITGLRTLTGSNQSMSAQKSGDLLNDIRNHLDVYNVNPKLLFKQKNDNTRVHLVAVTEIIIEDDKTKLCMSDSSVPAYLNEHCLSYAYIHQDGKMTYYPWNNVEIASVTIPSHEQAEMIQQQQNLYRFCRENQENCPL